MVHCRYFNIKTVYFFIDHFFFFFLVQHSAGIGRSGTFCTVHSVLEKLKSDLENMKVNPACHPPIINIYNHVLNIRKCRPGMVQTKVSVRYILLQITTIIGSISLLL